jgi:hypothetical protein
MIKPIEIKHKVCNLNLHFLAKNSPKIFSQKFLGLRLIFVNLGITFCAYEKPNLYSLKGGLPHPQIFSSVTTQHCLDSSNEFSRDF